MWFSLHATTLSCIILSTPWRGGPSSSAPMWTTASRRSPWTEWARPTDSTMSCLLEQVKGWFSLPTLSRKIEKGSWWPLIVIPDKGTVLKVINVPKGSWNNMEELLLEELEVFKVRQSFFFSPTFWYCWVWNKANVAENVWQCCHLAARERQKLKYYAWSSGYSLILWFISQLIQYQKCPTLPVSS